MRNQGEAHRSRSGQFTARADSSQPLYLPQVLAVYGFDSRSAIVRQVSHPWNLGNSFVIHGPSRAIFLKHWNSQTFNQTMKPATFLVEALKETSFKSYSEIVPTEQGDLWYADPVDNCWQAYTFLDGRRPTVDDVSIPAKLAQLVFDFRNSTQALGHLQMRESRLPQVSTAVKALLSAANNRKEKRLSIAILHEVLDRLNTISLLPRTIIHGDMLLENILEVSGKPHLVDFEFVRHDIRVFDLAALIIPLRGSDGYFKIGPASFISALISAMMKNAASSALVSKEEIELLPYACAARFALIYSDLSESNSIYADTVFPVIESLATSIIPSWKDICSDASAQRPN